jgi:hypothetical protein
MIPKEETKEERRNDIKRKGEKKEIEEKHKFETCVNHSPLFPALEEKKRNNKRVTRKGALRL